MFSDTAASKVTAAHLAKPVLLYVRQSTLKQVIHHTESAHRQYDLRSRAIALGWSHEQITVIDIDQGQSGASAADREGFQHLVAEVSLGRAGIVLGLECSRLARNSADWHQLLELCGITGTLICDEDGLYDPRQFNDRLLLGMKGQMSEAELHFIKARLRGGVLSKARRGELPMPLPVGLVCDRSGRVVLDPDTAVHQALQRLFDTFAATGSATACVKAFREADLMFPWRHLKGPHKGELDWKPLRHHTVLRVLHNPRYAGAFVYGRYAHQPRPNGKWSSIKLPREQWVSFIPDAHPGYITLDQFEANQARLAANAAAHGRDRTTGPAREGPALLQGIIVCGRCGNRMTVRYHHRRGQPFPSYVCQRQGIEKAQRICAAIHGADLDDRIGQLLLDTLTPLAVEAALAVADELQQRAADADRMRAAHVERARYHADLARRRYLAVDPANRLVADSLEADWNTALRELNDAQHAYQQAREQHAGELTDAQRERINQLVTDLPAIWHHPATPARERKRIARLLLTDVTVHREGDTITAHVRFPAGQHTTLTVPAPKTAGEQRKTPATVVTAIDELLDHHISGEIADILNQRGIVSGAGETFHRKIIDNIIHTYRLPSRRQRLSEAGMLTAAELADQLGIRPGTVKDWWRAGLVSGLRYNDKDDMCWGTSSAQTFDDLNVSEFFRSSRRFPMTMVGGLDVHRQQITFDYVDDDGVVHWGQIRPATRQMLRGWLAERCGDGDAEFALEGCTGWRYVCEELAAAGVGVHLGDPAEIAALRGPKKRAKTDRADARLLRTLLVEGRFPESWIPPAHVVEMRTLGRLYCTLMDERRAWQQRIHAQLFHQGCPSIAALLSAAGCDALAGAELSAAGRQHVDTALRRIDALSAEIGPLRAQLVSFARRQAGCRALQRHYGIGWLCAAIIWAEIGDARRFRSSDQLVRFAGLDVTVYSSDSKRSPGHLSRQGSPELRWVAFEAAKSAARRGSPDHSYYHRLAAKHDGHNGKNPTLAVERKILRRCYHTLRELGDAALALPVPEPEEVAA